MYEKEEEEVRCLFRGGKLNEGESGAALNESREGEGDPANGENSTESTGGEDEPAGGKGTAGGWGGGIE